MARLRQAHFFQTLIRSRHCTLPSASDPNTTVWLLRQDLLISVSPEVSCSASARPDRRRRRAQCSTSRCASGEGRDENDTAAHAWAQLITAGVGRQRPERLVRLAVADLFLRVDGSALAGKALRRRPVPLALFPDESAVHVELTGVAAIRVPGAVHTGSLKQVLQLPQPRSPIPPS
jgi:hypothetical protein